MNGAGPFRLYKAAPRLFLISREAELGAAIRAYESGDADSTYRARQYQGGPCLTDASAREALARANRLAAELREEAARVRQIREGAARAYLAKRAARPRNLSFNL